VNPAYKHLRDRLRVGELTVPQMIALFCGFMGGLVWALYVSPFGPYVTLFTGIYIACVPAGSVLLASTTEFDLWLYLRACVREVFTDGEYVAGPGEETDGYSIEPDESRTSSIANGCGVALEEIWDS